jgi:hypothetical protein
MFTSHTILMLRGQRQWRESLFEVEAKIFESENIKIGIFSYPKCYYWWDYRIIKFISC